MQESFCLNSSCDDFPTELPLPEVLANRYRFKYQLGSGGFAKTFLAVDELCLDKACVIKQFCPDQSSSDTHGKAMALFKQEAEVLGHLGHHPRIPALLAFFEEQQRLYLVQEFFEGQDLFKELQQKGPFSEEQVHQLLMNLLPVIHFAHKQKIIHRDIKLSNIIRQPNGTIILIDFGGALQLRNRINVNTGTMGYAAPEQIQGQVCPASDLYSLGITGMRLLTGSLPVSHGPDPLFTGSPGDWHWRQTGLKLGTQMSHVFDKLLAHDIENRFQSATEVIQILQEPARVALVDLPSQTGSPPVWTPQASRPFASEVSTSYRTLHAFLAAQNFKEADQETWKLMLKLTNREVQRSLSVFSLREFPVQDLLTIDRLWRLLSNGRFGFSVQQHIFGKAGGDVIFDYDAWKKFSRRVGWCHGETWLDYSQLTFNINAPPGHFPALFARGNSTANHCASGNVLNWWRLGFISLIQRLNTVENA